MDLEFRRFQREYFTEYVVWFSDPELNRRLGPMDEEWLEAVLTETEAEGITWAAFRGTEMVAVVETQFDPHDKLPAAITAVAVKPALWRQGIATAALEWVMKLHASQGIHEHIAYVSVSNPAGQRCLEKAGFRMTSIAPDEHGYCEYRR